MGNLFIRRHLSIKGILVLTFLVLLLIGQLWFIFGNSGRNADESDRQSDVFVHLFVKIIFGKEPEMISDSAYDIVTVCVRKAAHMTEFGVLAMLFLGIFTVVFERSAILLWSSLGCTFLCAVCDELTQLFSEGRACSFVDMLIDTAGGLIASALLYYVIGRLNKKTN